MGRAQDNIEMFLRSSSESFLLLVGMERGQPDLCLSRPAFRNAQGSLAPL